MREDEREELRALEEELLRPEVRADPDRLATLLHPQLVEFGRSGTIWSRASILDRLPTETKFSAVITNFEARLLAPDVALVTYEAEISNEAVSNARSLRASVWIRSGGPWQMRFHQGTPIPSQESSADR